MSRAAREAALRQEEKAVEGSLIFQFLRERAKEQIEPIETYSLFVGQPFSGKSSLIGLLQSSQRDKVPGPTRAMDYSFARKSNKSDPSLKDVAHIYEIGEGTEYATLFDIALSATRLSKCGVVGVVVDLSKPLDAVVWARRWLDLAAKILRKTLDELERRDPRLADSVKKRPVAVMLVANKYDLYKHSQPAMKKIVDQALRGLALASGASLHYTTVKEKSSFRSALGAALFRKPDKAKPVLDGPLHVPAGTDSFDDINAAGPLTLSAANLHRAIADGLADFFDKSPDFFDDDDDRLDDANHPDNEYPDPYIDDVVARKMAEVEAILDKEDALAFGQAASSSSRTTTTTSSSSESKLRD